MNLKISRDWATPLTIGVFALMACTGVLMFFHLDSQLQKTVHEWAGWVMLAGVAAHAAANWLAFKRHLQGAGRGLVIVAVFLAVLAGSFFVPAGKQVPSTPQLAISAVSRAPIAQVAPLFGKTAAQARADLAAVGIVVGSDELSLASVIGPDREKLGQALRALAQHG